ncbi:MAG: DNA polymerase III subunit delta [Hyphomicrobiaceae bacterium]
MVSVKAHLAEAFIAKLPSEIRLLLIYGTDPGRVSDYATAAARKLERSSTELGEIIRIDDPDLETNPDRLLVELQTLPMFGGEKIVRTSLGRRITSAALKTALESGPPAARLIVEGGNLKPTDALRKLAETAEWAAALPCYADSERDLSQLAQGLLQREGLSIDADALDTLIARLGSDRGVSRGEIEKLIVYCHGQTRVTLEDVEAVVGDTSAVSIDRVVMATFSGQAASAIAALDQAIAAGQAAQQALLALQRHQLLLARLSAALDAGRRLDDAVRALRPPLHFSLKDAVSQQLKTWGGARLSEANMRIQDAVMRVRSTYGAVEEPLVQRLILDLARLARSPSR